MTDSVEKESDMLDAINASSNNESEHVLDVEEPEASSMLTNFITVHDLSINNLCNKAIVIQLILSYN